MATEKCISESRCGSLGVIQPRRPKRYKRAACVFSHSWFTVLFLFCKKLPKALLGIDNPTVLNLLEMSRPSVSVLPFKHYGRQCEWKSQPLSHRHCWWYVGHTAWLENSCLKKNKKKKVKSSGRSERGEKKQKKTSSYNGDITSNLLETWIFNITLNTKKNNNHWKNKKDKNDLFQYLEMSVQKKTRFPEQWNTEHTGASRAWEVHSVFRKKKRVFDTFDFKGPVKEKRPSSELKEW